MDSPLFTCPQNPKSRIQNQNLHQILVHDRSPQKMTNNVLQIISKVSKIYQNIKKEITRKIWQWIFSSKFMRVGQ